MKPTCWLRRQGMPPQSAAGNANTPQMKRPPVVYPAAPPGSKLLGLKHATQPRHVEPILGCPGGWSPKSYSIGRAGTLLRRRHKRVSGAYIQARAITPYVRASLDVRQESTTSSAGRPGLGAVPAFGKWKKRPGRPIVVGGLRRLIEPRQAGQEVVQRDGRNRHLHGIQQSPEFSFGHRAR